MNLIRATLTNFMGHRHFVFEPNGHNADIFGDNGVGKTTIKHAFLWLFTDKDSDGKEAEGKGFRLKTLVDGKAIPMIDHSVELVMEENGKRFTLKKTLKENWVKKRGTSTQEFDGHVNSFEIDGVPKSKKEFDSFLARLCDESLLRMLMDPDYFPGKMKWEDRRRILMNICGDISDAEVIASIPALTPLTSILAGRNVEDHRKVLAAQKTKLNSEIEMIPIRVDEATRALPDVGQMKLETLRVDLENAREALKVTEASLATLEQGGGISQKRLQARNIEAEILSAQNTANAAKQVGIQASARELNELQMKNDAYLRERINALSQSKQLAVDIDRTNKLLVEKRAEWVTADESAFQSSVDSVCPTCSRELPEEQVQAANEKALADFNQKKSETLTRIEDEGIALKSKLTDMEIRKTKFDADYEQLSEKILVISKDVLTVQSVIDTKRSEQATDSVEVLALRQSLATIEQEIQQMGRDTEPQKISLTESRDSWRRTIASIESDIAKFAQREQGEKRIAELMAQEKKLAAEYGDLNKQTFLTEEFIRAKVGLLESRINSKFKVARFKMFEVQINGGLNEICEVLGPDGVPYSKGLNTAARINIGIDVINTLSEHFGVNMPIFADNSEAVTTIIDTNSQLIRLIKPEIRTEEDRKKYSKLIVEVG